jgi:hypothetical protein
MKKNISILTLLLISILAIGQDRYLDSYSISGQSGWVLPTNDYVKGENDIYQPITQIYTLSLRYERQTDGSRPWHQLYNYPSYGLGLYIADFNVKNQLGNPITLYGFFNSYLIEKQKWSIKTEVSLGLAFNWQHFTPETPLNDAMGGSMSCYVDAGLTTYRHIGEKLEIGAGIYLTHFSNGAMKKPNKGVNVLAPKITIKYKPYGKFEYAKSPLPTYEKNIEDLTSIFAGVHNVLTVLARNQVNNQYNSNNYVVLGLDKRYLKRLSAKHALGIGFGVGYNQYVGTTYYVENREMKLKDANVMERFNLSAYLSYEFKIHRLNLFLEPGYYVYKSIYDKSESFFQRIGLRYQLNEKWFCAIGLRSQYFSVAQYIEWGVGLRL